MTADEKRIMSAREEMLPLEAMINLNDIQEQAEKVLSRTAWAYYRSAANGEDSKCHLRESAKSDAEMLR